jgi:alpha-1,3-rhamnosyl/mannosyltransferase
VSAVQPANGANTHAARLRVGVNLLWLVPGVVGGSEEYTTRLLAGLADRPPDDLDLTLFALRPFTGAYPELARAFSTVVCPLDGDQKGLRVAAEATWLALAARRHRIDLVHHAGGTMPPVRTAPGIVTIHDLQPLLLPANFSLVKRGYLRWRLGPSARQARLVVTLTEFTRQSIAARLHVPAARVELVPPGYTPAIAEEPEGDPASAYGLPGPFFVYPAITYPHKNHRMLVRAFARLAEHHPDVRLVLTGGEATGEQALAEEIDRCGVSGSVRRLGRIPRGDLDWLLAHAVALVFPSRFEGFGLPVLEAMGQGCPVIAARATALPEVVGDAGILVDPDDEVGWSAAMGELLADGHRRTAMVAAGRARTAAFRWDAAAEHLAAVYRHAANRAEVAPS